MNRHLYRLAAKAACVLVLGFTSYGSAEVCNVKVVTDANPDYSDIGSMIHSATSNWKTNKEKVWAIFYWNHIARRQTTPMYVHGLALADPIRQFNDYGYTMCSTISGNNMAIFRAMGLKSRYWDISNHTVMDVDVDGHYAMIDSSLSAIYTLCDGKTWADVTEIGRDGACDASGGKVEPGHIAKYHCLNSTSPNGFLTGADTQRSVAEEYACFDPNGLKYRYYYNDWDLGHRYSLSLRDNEVYKRHYRRMDAESPNAVTLADKYRADPAYYIPNVNFGTGESTDPELANPRYRIRGNGFWTFRPSLAADQYKKAIHSEANIAVSPGGGLMAATAAKEGEVIFRISGANVITSQRISTATTGQVGLEISSNNGLSWQPVGPAGATKDAAGQSTHQLTKEVNGAYEVLIKARLSAGAVLKSIEVKTITQVNSKTQPRLRLGRNTVYVGTGQPTQSVVLWPDLRGDAWKSCVIESNNVVTFKSDKGKPEHPGYLAVMFAEKANEDAYIVFRLDTPRDMTSLSYGGRLYNRSNPSNVDMLHSFDGGKTWTRTYSLTDTSSPWDVIRYEKASQVPQGVRSALVKYRWKAKLGAGPSICGLYAVRMEAGYAPVDSAFKPLEVAFTWKEAQKGYTTLERSHVQLVEKVPFTYEINVGGEDHPVMESLQMNVKGATNVVAPGPVKYGYSDGKDVGGEKFRDRWETLGKVISTGKPYTASEKSLTQWNAGDPNGTKLTDGVVGSTYNGGVGYTFGVVYDRKMKPQITVDLGAAQKCGAFRIQVGGWEPWDALKGEIKDKVEVLTSADGKEFTSRGFINFDLRWKDIPANFCWPDEETMVGHNAALVLDKPVDARFVKYMITPARLLAITEVQVLDSITYAPFDLKIALPDGKDRSDITRYPLRHDPAQEYKR